MNCPREHGALNETQMSGAMVSACGQCGGMFLERGELNRIAGSTSGDLEYSTVDLENFEHDDEYGPINCPHHPDRAMKKAEFNILTNIILDYCDACGGFWIDGRELVRIQEEVRGLNEAAEESTEPWVVRLSQFFWGLPFPH